MGFTNHSFLTRVFSLVHASVRAADAGAASVMPTNRHNAEEKIDEARILKNTGLKLFHAGLGKRKVLEESCVSFFGS